MEKYCLFSDTPPKKPQTKNPPKQTPAKKLEKHKKRLQYTTKRTDQKKLFHHLRDPVTRTTLLPSSEVPTTAKCQRVNSLMKGAWHSTPLEEDTMRCPSHAAHQHFATAILLWQMCNVTCKCKASGSISTIQKQIRKVKKVNFFFFFTVFSQ